MSCTHSRFLCWMLVCALALQAIPLPVAWAASASSSTLRGEALREDPDALQHLTRDLEHRQTFRRQQRRRDRQFAGQLGGRDAGAFSVLDLNLPLPPEVRAQLEEPARPFDPGRDVHEPVSLEVMQKLLDVLETSADFSGKRAIRHMLTQAVTMKRADDVDWIFWADHLPGRGRAQRIAGFHFHILLDRKLRWIFDGEHPHLNRLRPPEQSALLLSLLLTVGHEIAELLMEAHPDVHWDNPLDPPLPSTEAAAVRMELRLLTSTPLQLIEMLKSFLRGRPVLWSQLYELALKAIAAKIPVETWLDGEEGQHAVNMYVLSLGYAWPRVEEVKKFERFLQERVDRGPYELRSDTFLKENERAAEEMRKRTDDLLGAVVRVRSHQPPNPPQEGMGLVVGEDETAWFLLISGAPVQGPATEEVTILSPQAARVATRASVWAADLQRHLVVLKLEKSEAQTIPLRIASFSPRLSLWSKDPVNVISLQADESDTAAPLVVQIRGGEIVAGKSSEPSYGFQPIMPPETFGAPVVNLLREVVGIVQGPMDLAIIEDAQRAIPVMPMMGSSAIVAFLRSAQVLGIKIASGRTPFDAVGRDAEAEHEHREANSTRNPADAQLHEALHILHEVSTAPPAIQGRLTEEIAGRALAIVQEPDSRRRRLKALTTLLAPLGVPKPQDVASRLERRLSGLLVTLPDPVRLIFTAHGSAACGRHAAEHLREFVNDVPNTTPIIVWPEMPIPTEIFSIGKIQELQDRASGFPSGVPHIEWASEILQNPPRKRILDVLRDLVEIFSEGMRAKLVDEARQANTTGQDQCSLFLQPIYDEISVLRRQGRTVDVQWEQFPPESYFSHLRQTACSDKGKACLLEGKKEQAETAFRQSEQAHEQRDQVRDQALARAIQQSHAQRPDALHVVMRGSTHSYYLPPALTGHHLHARMIKIEVSRHNELISWIDEAGIRWLHTSKADDFHRVVCASLFEEFFDGRDVPDEVYALLQRFVIGVPVSLLAQWFEELPAGMANLQELGAVTLAWFGEHQGELPPDRATLLRLMQQAIEKPEEGPGPTGSGGGGGAPGSGSPPPTMPGPAASAMPADPSAAGRTGGILGSVKAAGVDL